MLATGVLDVGRDDMGQRQVQVRGFRSFASDRNGGRYRSRGYAIAMGAGLLFGIVGCTTTGGAASLLDVDQRVVIEGQVASIDQTPMAYDGDALLVVTSAARGAVTVHLPARRNLCKAQGLDLLDALKVGDRVRVEGVATGTGDVRVCQDAADRLQRID